MTNMGLACFLAAGYVLSSRGFRSHATESELDSLKEMNKELEQELNELHERQ